MPTGMARSGPRTLPGNLRLTLEAAVDGAIENLDFEITPANLGSELADTIYETLAKCGEGAVLERRSRRELARHLASVFRKGFGEAAARVDEDARRGIDRMFDGPSRVRRGLVARPDPSDVIDVFSTWASIAWTAVDAARAQAREAARAPVQTFEEALVAGGWRPWLTDRDLRARLFAAPATFAPLIARGLGAPPRDSSGLALLALLDDRDAAEELAMQLGDISRADRVLDVLDWCVRVKLRSPLAAERGAREIARLPSGPTAWRVAALCTRRLATAIPELDALVADAAAAVQAACGRSEERFVLTSALALLDAAAKHGKADVAREAALAVLEDVIARPAMRNVWREDAVSAVRLLAGVGGGPGEPLLLQRLVGTSFEDELAHLAQARLDVLATARAP